MTKEEAKRKVREYLTDILPSDCSNEIDEIMKALEQPSCKDAISRTELIQKLNAWDSKAHGIPNYAWKVIRELPSVTPERPKGKWIYKEYDDRTGMGDSFFCSECGEPRCMKLIKYCPNCGAEMSGGGEDGVSD